MIDKETAINTVKNMRRETPETKRLLDYQIGDYIQILGKGEHTGRVGVIIGMNIIKPKHRPERFIYTIRISDKSAITLLSSQMRFLRHADEPQE